MDIIELSPSEWEQFRDLREHAVSSDPLAFGIFAQELQTEPGDYQGKLSREDRKYFFVRVQDQLIGMLGVVLPSLKQYQHTSIIVGMFVVPEFRRKGVGTRLVEHALNYLAQKGRSKVKLEVTSSQEAAIKLYWKCGFREIGRHKNEVEFNGIYYDDVLMERTTDSLQ